jgi:hypothetical protein
LGAVSAAPGRPIAGKTTTATATAAKIGIRITIK